MAGKTFNALTVDSSYLGTKVLRPGFGKVVKEINCLTMNSSGAFVVNVRDFGAIGDGITDDQPAIQAAIESLAATGGTVFVPAGDYRLGDSVVIDQNNITLTGQGTSSILRLMDGVKQIGIIIPQHYSDTIGLDPNLIIKNTTISNLVIDGNHNPLVNYNDPNHGPDYFGIMLRQASNTMISGVVVRNWQSDGISVSNGSAVVQGTTIQNCLVTEIGRNGIHIGFAYNTTIKNNYVTGVPSQYWEASAACSIDVEVEGDNAAQTYPGRSGTFAYPYVVNLTIQDNILERVNAYTAGDAIALQPAYGPIQGVTIQNNLILNHQYGVGSTYTGSNTLFDGVTPNVDQVSILNNWIGTPTLNVGGQGIHFEGTGDSTVSGNFIHDQMGNYSYGMYLENVVHGTFSGNYVERDRNADFTNYSIQAASDHVTMSQNRYDNDFTYLDIGTSVTNLTNDGGVSVASSAFDKTYPTCSVGISPGTHITSPTAISVTASDDVAIARVYYFIDSLLVGFSTSGPYSFVFDPGKYTAGSHTVMALALDTSVNATYSSTVSVVV